MSHVCSFPCARLIFRYHALPSLFSMMMVHSCHHCLILYPIATNSPSGVVSLRRRLVERGSLSRSPHRDRDMVLVRSPLGDESPSWCTSRSLV